jgi:hypothetical protein
MRIKDSQMAAMRALGRAGFEREMTDHARTFSPALAATLGPDLLRAAVRDALLRALEHGFTRKGPQRLFLELSLLFGSGFDADPQYAHMHRILDTPDDQTLRARALHGHVLLYVEHVAGLGGAHVYDALRFLRSLTTQPDPFDGGTTLTEALVAQMTQGFPQRARYAGESALRALVLAGLEEAAKHRFEGARASALMPVLMFAFGRGCAEDQFYPWIGATLADPRITDPAGRAQRLERKAVTWLDHVLAAEDAA